MKTKDEIMALARRCEHCYCEYFTDYSLGKSEELYDLLEAERNALSAALDEVFAERDAALEGWRCECSTEDACRFARERDAAIAERDALKQENLQIHTLMNLYNVGGWTDSLDLMKERDALKAECEGLRAELGDLPEAQAEMLSEIKRLKAELRKLTP